MSLRIVPQANHPKSHTHHPAPGQAAASVPALPDPLRAGLNRTHPNIVPPSSSATPPIATPTSSHPLEARLKAWEATQTALRHETLRRTFGIAEPVRREMELKMVREGEWRPMCLGGVGSVHEDVLRGREALVDWEDVYRGEERMTGMGVGVLEQMELRLRI